MIKIHRPESRLRKKPPNKKQFTLHWVPRAICIQKALWVQEISRVLWVEKQKEETLGTQLVAQGRARSQDHSKSKGGQT